jgi:hypothetical protein
MKTVNLRWNARKTVMALALAGVLGGVAAGPALADDGTRHGAGQQRYEHQDRREQGWREQGFRRQEWREPAYREHRAYAYAAPSYRYAAPGYAYAPRPGLNVVIPFDIR